ncbi:MAG TPA: ATP-binding protein [Anaeromyxobacteraceae bacterium]|nr:ATP-binding protein [Anaeromyxobacteraceae bacterium]
MENALHIQLRPEWDAIRGAWEPCDRHLEAHGLGRDDAYALCMVAQELLENAVKYGAYEGGQPPVDLALEVTPEEVTVEVRSPVGVDPAALGEFDRTIQWIRGFQDPFEAYVDRLKRASSRAAGSGESGLGLARVAYEGRCVLDFYVDASNTLAVSAVRRR